MLNYTSSLESLLESVELEYQWGIIRCAGTKLRKRHQGGQLGPPGEDLVVLNPELRVTCIRNGNRMHEFDAVKMSTHSTNEVGVC